MPSLCKKKLLGKVAYFENKVVIIGGEADATAEVAKIGEWKWEIFDILEEIALKH